MTFRFNLLIDIKNINCKIKAGNQTRTDDLLITNELLYRLSYTSIFIKFGLMLCKTG